MTRVDIIRLTEDFLTSVCTSVFTVIGVRRKQMKERVAIDANGRRYVTHEPLLHEREKVAEWMIERGYATGHGDTVEDLLKELEWQVEEREREACAKIAEFYEPICDRCPSGVATAIRAKGEQA